MQNSAPISTPEKQPTVVKNQSSSIPLAQSIIDEKVSLLESTFNIIYKERMLDLPIINKKIHVKAMGFQAWQNSYLCIMITPWFMNLMLLPGASENWDDKIETTSHKYIFPSGNYSFLVGFEDAIGKYQTCSLFSPMFDFADNEAAIDTAQAAIKELMNNENIEDIDIDSKTIEGIWGGSVEHPDKVAARKEAQAIEDAIPQQTLEVKMQKPISRRELLRGVIRLDKEDK